MTTTAGEPVRPATATGPGRATADTPYPEVALLSNGSYGVLITAAGAGVGTWRDLDVTRWREDATRDCWGQFCYVRDLGDGTAWSVGHQPLCRTADEYDFAFHADRAEFRRRDGAIETRLAVRVAPDHDAEVRLVTLINHGDRPRELDLTSYAEVCLNHRRADQAHPAFAKLFLETEFVPGPDALLARRRPRAADQKPIWAVHVSAADGPVEYETDRARFLGRGRTPANPAALDRGARLSGTTGPVLDPVFSLRRGIRLAPGATASVAFVTGAAETREAALALAEHFRDLAVAERVDGRARVGDELQELGLTPDDVALFNRLAGAVVFTGPALRVPDAVAANRQGQPGLWPHAISGDRPIVLARVGTAGDESLVRQLVQWHAYARRRGLDLDLVLLDERPGDAAEQLKADLQTGPAGPLLDKAGGVFVLAAGQVPADDAVLLKAAARVVLGGGRGSLAEQLERPPESVALPPAAGRDRLSRTVRARPACRAARGPLVLERPGRVHAGRPRVRDRHRRGADSAAGPVDQRARQPRLRLPGDGGRPGLFVGGQQPDEPPDPLVERPGVRPARRGGLPARRGDGRGLDADAPAAGGRRGRDRPPRPGLHPLHPPEPRTGAGPAGAGPARRPGQAGPPDACATPATGPGGSRRRSTPSGCSGPSGTTPPLQVVCERDAEAGAVLARSAWAGSFAGQLAFAAVGPRPHTATADRTEFLGRNGSPADPAALGRAGLSGRVGPALDPCAALMTPITLAPGQTEEVVFVLGQADTPERVRQLVATYTAPGRARQALAEVQALWDRVLGAVQVKTPDAALDVMMNRWLPYQVLACRVWGRSAFYQSGGAYGFRDQLQDVMALVYARPGRGAGPDPALGRAAVRGRGRAALVAPAGRRRRPHPHHRRPDVPAAGRSTTTSPPPATPRCSTSGCRS